MSLCAGLSAALLPCEALGAVPTIGKPPGRPQILLNRLTMPPGVPGAATYAEHLRKTLKREARRADWGAGRGSTISYRFVIEKLTLTQRGNVLEVECSARGELPRRRHARSRLKFGGDPAKMTALVCRVLEIVARGVITRLAELERSRRERLM